MLFRTQIGEVAFAVLAAKKSELRAVSCSSVRHLSPACITCPWAITELLRPYSRDSDARGKDSSHAPQASDDPAGRDLRFTRCRKPGSGQTRSPES